MEESPSLRLTILRNQIQQSQACYKTVLRDKQALEELKHNVEEATLGYRDKIVKLQQMIDNDQVEKDNQRKRFQDQLDQAELENKLLLEKQQTLRNKLQELEDERFCLEQHSRVSALMPKRPLVFSGKTREGKSIDMDFHVMPEIHYPVTGGCALVTFEDRKVAQNILDMEKHVVEIGDCRIKIKSLPIKLPMLKEIEIQTRVCKERILVSEIPKILTDDQLLDKLELHFSRGRNSGGDVKGIELLEDSGNVVIAFEKDGIAENLTKKEFHQVEIRGGLRDVKKIRLRVSPFISGELVHVEVSDSVCKRSVLLTEIPDIMDPEELQDLLEIHFQKPSLGGGEVDSFTYVPQGRSAIANFTRDDGH